MLRHTPGFLSCIVLAVALTLSVAPLMAGQLASDGANSYLGIWAGSSAFSSGTLNGTVEWAVYGPGNAPAGMAGYVTTPGELLYAYQVFVDPSAPLSQLAVNVQNPADNIGTFTASSISGIVPDFYEFSAGEAIWYFGIFGGPEVQPGQTSMGLAFSSPNVPMWDVATVIDGGQSDQLGVPSTSPLSIPEPSSIALVFCGVAVFACQWLRRSRKVLR
jgi:hypothetical protein